MEAYPVACHVYFQKLKPYTNKINVSRGPLNFVVGGGFVWLMHICNVHIFYVIQNLIGEDPVHTAPSLLVAKVQRGHTISKRMVIKQYNIFTPIPEFSVVYLRLKYKIILISGTIYACKYSAW